MKTLLLVCLCLSSWMLVSCKPTNTTPPKVSFSHNRIFDIQTDIRLLRNLAQQQNQESAIFQQQALNAIRSGNGAQIDQVIQNMEQQVNTFNQQLLNLALSSSEVDSIRKTMIHSNNLSLALAQQGAAKKPDAHKIERLQQQLAKAQDDIHHLNNQIQEKLSQAS